MAKVLRCPACGALWRVRDDFNAGMLRCTACQSVFSADKTESLSVADEALDARLTQAMREALEAREETESREGTAAMGRLANDLTDFDGREDAPTPAVATPEAEPTPTDLPSERSDSTGHPILWTLFVLILLAAGAAAGLFFGHKAVLSTFPQFRPVYEDVCTKVPCPHFVWHNAKAFKVTAEIEQPIDEADEADREAAHRLPVVLAKLSNTSAHPQALPILELKLVDAAGTVVGQRVLEPVDYGYDVTRSVQPGGYVTARLTVREPLSNDAVTAVVTPVSDL